MPRALRPSRIPESRVPARNPATATLPGPARHGSEASWYTLYRFPSAAAGGRGTGGAVCPTQTQPLPPWVRSGSAQSRARAVLQRPPHRPSVTQSVSQSVWRAGRAQGIHCLRAYPLRHARCLFNSRCGSDARCALPWPCPAPGDATPAGRAQGHRGAMLAAPPVKMQHPGGANEGGGDRVQQDAMRCVAEKNPRRGEASCN